MKTAKKKIKKTNRISLQKLLKRLSASEMASLIGGQDAGGEGGGQAGGAGGQGDTVNFVDPRIWMANNPTQIKQ